MFFVNSTKELNLFTCIWGPTCHSSPTAGLSSTYLTRAEYTWSPEIQNIKLNNMKFTSRTQFEIFKEQGKTNLLDIGLNQNAYFIKG